MDDAALRVTNLTVRLGRRIVLDGLGLCVQCGDIYGFLGPNGSGKTTALRAILGLVRRQKGDISVLGDSTPAARRFVGAVVDTPVFQPWCTGADTLRTSGMLAGLFGAALEGELARVLDRVGLTARARDRASTYSLGMRQRLGLARALLGRPRLLLLDEPTNGLDPAGMKDMRELLRSLALLDGITIFLSSHLLAEVSALCNRVGILRGGRLAAEGRVQDLLSGDVREVEIGGNASAIEAALLEFPGLLSLGPTATGRVRLRLDSATVPDVVRRLALANVDVMGVWPETRSLEDVYVEVTR